MILVGAYTLDVDGGATSEAYGRIAVPGPERCACWYCQNWVSGRERLVPAEVRKLLSDLSVPLNGEINVWEVPGDEPRAHGYGGWYMVAGRIVSSPVGANERFDLGGWKIWFKPRASYRVPEFDGLEVFEIHFFTWATSYIDGNPNDVA